MIAKMQSCRIIKCGVVDDEYCFDTSCVLSVRQGEVLRQEGASVDGIAGVVSHGGHSIPVFRLDELLGYSTRSKGREHIVVLSTGQGVCGLIVNNVSRAALTPEMVAPLPKLVVNPHKPFFFGVANFAHGPVDVHAREAVEADCPRRQSERTDAALLISPDGLFDERSATEPISDVASQVNGGGLRHRSGRQRGQLMVFELPEVTSIGAKTAIALSITQVLEVNNPKRLLYVPGAPDVVLGIVNWREHFVPVVDIARMLGLTSVRAATQRRLVVARYPNKQLLGFHSDASIKTVRLPIEAEPCDVPGVTDTPLVHAGYATNDGILLVPALEELALLASTT